MSITSSNVSRDGVFNSMGRKDPSVIAFANNLSEQRRNELYAMTDYLCSLGLSDLELISTLQPTDYTTIQAVFEHFPYGIEEEEQTEACKWYVNAVGELLSSKRNIHESCTALASRAPVLNPITTIGINSKLRGGVSNWGNLDAETKKLWKDTLFQACKSALEQDC